jgi:hypothetical protein
VFSRMAFVRSRMERDIVTVAERISRATADLPRCVYCGWPTLVGRTACQAHSDLPALDLADVVRLRMPATTPTLPRSRP